MVWIRDFQIIPNDSSFISFEKTFSWKFLPSARKENTFEDQCFLTNCMPESDSSVLLWTVESMQNLQSHQAAWSFLSQKRWNIKRISRHVEWMYDSIVLAQFWTTMWNQIQAPYLLCWPKRPKQKGVTVWRLNGSNGDVTVRSNVM